MKKGDIFYSLLLSLIVCICAGNNCFSQVAINTNDASPDNSAGLDVAATDAGFLIPRMDSTARNNIPAPATGLLIYNTTTNLFNIYAPPGWMELYGTAYITNITGTAKTTRNVGINILGAVADSSAMCDISSNIKGLLIPRTTTSSITNPATGLIIYNTVTGGLYFYNGSTWIEPCAQLTTTITGVGSLAGTSGVAINNTGAAPDASAILDINFSARGLLIPRMDDAGRNNLNPVTGLTLYNTSTNLLNYWNGSGWYSLSSLPVISTITGNTTPCQNQNGVIYSVNNIAGAIYLWSYSGTGVTIATGDSTNSITVNFSDSASSGALSVTPSGACGNGNTQTLNIFVGAIAAQPGPITGDTAICVNQDGVPYSVANVPAVIYNWNYSGTGFTIATGAGTNAITANFSGTATSGTLSVTPVNACGNGTAQTADITVSTSVPAQPDTVTGPSFVTVPHNGVAYSVPGVPGVTYTWAYPDTSFTVASGQGTNSIIANFSYPSACDTLTVTPSNACGNGTPRAFPIGVTHVMDTYYGTVYGTGGNPTAEELSMGGWGDTYYDFFEFDLTCMPSAAQTNTAELWLYVTTGRPYDAQLQIERITSPWTEAGVNISSYPSYVYYEPMTGSTTTGGWKVTDITTLYKEWQNGTYPNYGVELIPNYTNESNSDIVSSNNVSYPDTITYADYWPKIVVY